VTVEISNVGMAPCGIDEANSRMYSTSACSGMGRNTCDEGGSVTKTTDDPGAAYSWGGSLGVSSSISGWGTLENKNFSLWGVCESRNTYPSNSVSVSNPTLLCHSRVRNTPSGW
jgi:hypothetical protein